ncbi:MAG: PAS domain S-box protein [Minicystis sp.]
MAIPEGHLHAALDAAGLGVWDWDLATGRIAASPPLLDILGLDPDALAGGMEALLAPVHDEDRDAFVTDVLRAVAARRDHRAEVRVVRPDGALRRITAAVRAIADAAGEIVALAGVIEDVTARWEAEQAHLHPDCEPSDEQRLLAAVLQHMPAGVMVLEDTGIIRVVNERCNAIMGLGLVPGDKLQDRFRITILEPSGTPRAYDAHPLVRTLFHGEAVEDLETIFVHEDGRRVVVSVSTAPLREPEGGIDAAVGIYVDITERARLRDEVAGHRARLAAVLEAIPVGVLIAEAPQGSVSYANAAAQRLVRGTPTDITSLATYRKHRAFTIAGEPIEPGDLPLVRALVRGDVASGVELAFEVAPGEISYFRCNAAPLHDASGAIVAAVCAFDDITREIEARRQREQTERFRELFVGMLGHDLRSPLASILTAASLLLRRGTLGPDDAKAADRISAAGLRMKRMIEQILDLTRSRLGGGIPVVPHRTDLCDLTRRIIEEVEAAHQGRTIRFSTRGEPRCWCDPDRLGQVISNLVGNALHHTTPDVPVDVVVERTGNVVRVEVHNGGPPIPPELLPVIFNPFRRSAAAEKDRPAEGLGLGLYISQQIALAHGGRIEVASTAEAGTTFTLMLPVRRVRPGM